MYCLMCLLIPNYRGIWKTSVSLTSVTCQRLPWNCSRSNSTWNLVLCFSWYDDSWSKAEPWRSLPTLMILWIYDWHKVRAFGELSLLLINRPDSRLYQCHILAWDEKRNLTEGFHIQRICPIRPVNLMLQNKPFSIALRLEQSPSMIN